MNEGWWLDYKTKRFVSLLCLSVDHEMAIRDIENQAWLSISASVVKELSKFRPRVDRDRLILYMIQQCPLMRVRGHGSYASFEYWSPSSDLMPYTAIQRWVIKYAGPTLVLNSTNLATGRNEQVVAKHWSAFIKNQKQGAAS